VYQTALGRWPVDTANYGDLIATESIHHIRPVLALLVAIAYAIALLAGTALLPRYARGSSCLTQAVVGRVDPRGQQLMAGIVAYLAEGDLDRGGSPRFHKMITSDVPNGTFYSRAKLTTSALLGAVVVLAIFLHQPFGESTTYSWFAGCLFLPGFEYSRVVISKAGWEPFAISELFSGR
jgi:hypothetical protein